MSNCGNCIKIPGSNGVTEVSNGLFQRQKGNGRTETEVSPPSNGGTVTEVRSKSNAPSTAKNL